MHWCCFLSNDCLPHRGYHYNPCDQYTGTSATVIQGSWCLGSGSVAPTNTKYWCPQVHTIITTNPQNLLMLPLRHEMVSSLHIPSFLDTPFPRRLPSLADFALRSPWLARTLIWSPNPLSDSIIEVMIDLQSWSRFGSSRTLIAIKPISLVPPFAPL